MDKAATWVGPPQLPTTKGACQRLLRNFGFTGLKIDEILQPEQVGDKVEARIFVLTSPVLQESGDMVRQARTIVFTYENDEVRATELEGWVVS